MKQISVIVPVYNTKEEYLRKCIDSLIVQTIYKETEIIIIDDGSKKECAKICDEYSLKHENIQVIHQENQGLSISRNNGMKIAKGKWIMFVDSDDWIENNMCEKLLNLEQEDIDIIMVSCKLCYKNKCTLINNFDGKDRIWNKDNKNKIELQMIYAPILGREKYNAKYFITAWGKLYRRSFLERYKLYNVCNLKFKEDNIFNLHCFELANKIIYKNYCLYNYRQCKNSLIHVENSENIGLYIDYLNEELKFIKQFNKPHIFYEAHYIKVIQSVVNIVKQYIINSDNNYKEKRQMLVELTNNSKVKEAIKNIEIKHVSGLRKLYLKLILWLLKNKMYLGILEFAKILNIISNMKNEEMYE